MSQSRPYEFMVQFTPQRQWIEGSGILFWLAFFFVELGAGAFLISSIFGSLPGMLIGWLIAALLGGGLHLLYLGHPLRAWRMLVSSGWKTSWISRGLSFVGLFLILGLAHMLLIRSDSSPLWLLIAADIFAFLAVIYGGFAMSYVNGIQLWNTAVLPVLFVVASIWGGIGLTLIAVSMTGATSVLISLEGWARLFLAGYAVILATYLMSVRYQGPGGKTSVKEILAGRLSPLFWVVVIALGIVLPGAAVLLSLAAGLELSGAFLYLMILLELLGDMFLRYCILKAGYYAPLIPTSNYS